MQDQGSGNQSRAEADELISEKFCDARSGLAAVPLSHAKSFRCRGDAEKVVDLQAGTAHQCAVNIRLR